MKVINLPGHNVIASVVDIGEQPGVMNILAKKKECRQWGFFGAREKLKHEKFLKKEYRDFARILSLFTHCAHTQEVQ
jgi:hypothetical protein